MKTRLIGIAGRSGSGKSELAHHLAALLPGKTEVVGLDSYYFALDALPLEERGRRNFDHPDSLDWPLIARHARALSRGEAIEEPEYLFETHTRSAKARLVTPSQYLILEGLLTFHSEEVRSCLDAGIFVETPDRVCFERRLHRDIVERGRTVECVARQYSETVRPMAQQFIDPSARHADLIVRGDAPLEEMLSAARQFLEPGSHFLSHGA